MQSAKPHAATTEVLSCSFDVNPGAPWGRAGVAAGSKSCTVVVTWPEGLSYPLLVDPSWSTTFTMGQQRANFSLTLLSNGRVLAAGGVFGDGGTTNTAELYDPTTGTWAYTGSLTAGSRVQHSALLLNNGKVLVAGGYVSDGAASKSAELYDPSSGTWAGTNQMGKERAAAGRRRSR